MAKRKIYDVSTGAVTEEEYNSENHSNSSDFKFVYEISKVEIIRRMTTEEATSAELLIASADAKFRLMWSSANIIRSDDEWFPILQAALAGAFGEERAAQLLAPVANS